MSAWDDNSLRWSKNGIAVGWDVPVGSVVRAEIVNANAAPLIFRVWRRRPVLTAALVWVKPRPIPLLVAGQGGGIVWSEDFNTGAVRKEGGAKYIFDPGVDKPRSGPLSVIPGTTIKRGGRRKVLLSATGKVLHLVGIKFELGADHSRELVYNCTAAVDPDIALSMLEAEAAVAYLAQLAADEILEHGDGGTNELDAGAIMQRIHERFRVADEPPASVSLVGERHFAVDVLEPRTVTLRIEGQRPGFGLFAIQAVTLGGDPMEKASVSDVTLYELSDDGSTVTLYDGFIDEAEIELDEAYVHEDEETELTLESAPIWDSTEEFA